MERDSIRATLVGFVVAGCVFAVMYWLVDAEAVVTAIVRADVGLVAVVGGMILLWNLSWGVALWSVLRTQDTAVPLGRSILLHAATAFANHVTPLGQAGGEPITAWLITRTVETDYEVGLASVASFDAVHLLPSLSFATVGAVYLVATTTLAGSELGYLPVAVVVVAVGFPVLGFVVWRYRRSLGGRVSGSVARGIRRVADLLPGVPTPDLVSVYDRMTGFVEAVERVATDRRRLALALGFSALGWVFQAIGLWVAFESLSASIPVYLPFLVVPIGATGGGLPTPGGLGGIEAVNVSLLTLLTAVNPATIAAAVTIHSVGGYLLTTSLGAAATSVLGLKNFSWE